MKESQCKDYWALVLLVIVAFLYSAFLLFQKNVKDFTFGSALSEKTLANGVKQLKRRLSKKDFDQKDKEENSLRWDSVETQDQKDEGGMFLIILFYYFQDAAIIHIKTIYVNSDSAVVNSIKQIVGSIFKFRIDLLHLAKSMCAVTGLTPARKIVFKLLFVPTVLFILIFVYVLSANREKRKRNRYWKVWNLLARRAALAIMFAILFSYQKLSISLFQLVNCVTINNNSVLFIDGEVECYTPSQIIVFFKLVCTICPFSFYISLFPALMKHGYISLAEFFMGCLFPLPMAIYWAIKYGLAKLDKVEPSHDAVSVYKLLQGPYREFDLPGIFRYTCWSGVLLIRRLCLILAATFIKDVIIRLAVMMAVCQIALLHHVLVKPCKERRGNVAGTVSSSALLTVCTVNFLRAAYESAEYVPEGPNFTLMKVLDQVENSLLIWIPLVGVVTIILILIGRLLGKKLMSKGSSVDPVYPAISENQARSKTYRRTSSIPINSIHNKISEEGV